MSRLSTILVIALLAVSAVAAQASSGTETSATSSNATAATASESSNSSTSAANPEVVNRMQKPEISTSALTGLLVGFTFLAIFVPGFLCLWNIQPPKTFEPVEKSDARKKAQ